MATAALGQTRSASVLLGYQGLLKGAAYRIADECFVPVESLKAAGWDIQTEDNRANINAEGRLIDVPMRTVNGNPSIAIRKAIDKLGGETIWTDDDHLEALAIIKSINVHNGKVELKSTMGVKPTIAFFDSPNRIVIDFPGSKLSRSGDFVADSNTRVGQFQPDTVRIVVEAEEMPKLPEGFYKPTRSFKFDATPDTEKEDARPTAPPTRTPRREEPQQPTNQNPVTPATDDGSAGGVLPPTQGQNPTSTPVSNVGPLVVQVESTQSLVMSMRLAGPLSAAPRTTRPEPNVFEVILPGADVHLADGFKLDADIVEQVATRKDGSLSIISVRTKRPVGVELAASANDIVIRMMKPNVGNGRLAGKTIVVDAGHGGHDNGAKAPDGSVFEKNLTLSFATLVSQKLGEEGATVILTRKTDVFIPLEERSEIANRNGADFFISIHVNSNSLNNSTSGGITFYHLNDQVGQLLAQTIQHEIGSLVSIPSIGAWSDGRIYHTGFAVLRHSRMPAVLIETGFINHSGDRAKLQTEEYRDSLAAAIVKGLKVFMGDVK